MTIEEIINRARGDRFIAAKLNITYDAVYLWRKRGIPQKHWKVVCTLAMCAPSDIYVANQSARKHWKPRKVVGGKQNA